MNIFKKITNFTKALFKYSAAGFTDVDVEEYRGRMKICNSCDLNKNGNCEACGCIIRKKAWWKTEDCPKDKWPKLP